MAAFVLVLAEPILAVWLGDRLETPEQAAMAAALSRLVVIGATARAISDGWVRILYGAGHVRRYAPLVLAAGIANPFIAIALIYLLPAPVRYTAPVYHVHHERPYRNDAQHDANRALYGANRAARMTATPFGLGKAVGC